MSHAGALHRAAAAGTHRRPWRAAVLYAGGDRADPADPDQCLQEPARDLQRAFGPADSQDLLPHRLRQGAGQIGLRPLFRQQHDRDHRQRRAGADRRRHGRLGAQRIQIPRQCPARALHGHRRHGADPPGQRQHPAAHGESRSGQHADGPGPGLYGPGPAARHHPAGRIHAADPARSARRRALRRHQRIPHLLERDPAAGAPGDRHRRGLHHRADLERPLVSPDPGAGQWQADHHPGRAAVHRPICRATGTP